MTKGKTECGRILFHRDELKFAFAATDDFIGSVSAGQIFEVETEININAGVLTSLDNNSPKMTSLCRLLIPLQALSK